MIRDKTINTTTVLRTKSIKTGKVLKKEEQINIECCQYINSQCIVSKFKTLEMELMIYFNKMPKEYRSKEFIKKWLDFINTFGLNIKLRKDKYRKDLYYAYMEDQVLYKNYFYLFNLSLIRYLWSTHYSKFPAMIFMLRDRKDLKHLENWEIFQLSHHISDTYHFNDMTPVNTSKLDSAIFHITSQKFLTNRLRENFDSNLSTFNIPWKDKDLNYRVIRTLAKEKNYLEIYNKLSLVHNKLSEYQSAKCIKNKGLEETLTLNNNYRIIRELKSVIKIENDNYNPQLYKKSRFKLI